MVALPVLGEATRPVAALLANSLDAVAVLDAEARVLFTTPSIQRIQGYRPEEFVGTNAFDHVHPDDLDRMRATFAETVARRGEPVTVLFRARHRDGSFRTVEAVVASFLEDPEVAGVVANFRDVTARLELESQMLEGRQMEAVGHLASGVAHDLNNFLTAIVGFSDLLLDRAGDDPEMAPGLREIRRAADRARGLGDQLLALGRRDELRREVFDLNDRLADLKPLVRQLLGEGSELLVRLHPHAGRVLADAGKVDRVLLNLAVNARDAIAACAKGGRTVTVSSAPLELSAEAARSRPDARPGRYAVLSVADTGCGIPPEHLSRIFEPFFTTKERGKGTGLGLAAVYGMVRRMDGFVEVTSRVGRGTEFQVHLPRR